MASKQSGPKNDHGTSLQPWHYTFAVIVLGLGTLLSLAIFSALDRRQKGQTEQEFERVAEDYQASLVWNLESHAQSAESLRALPVVAGGFDAEKFRALAAPLLRQYPGVVAVEWIPRIRQAQRADWERADRPDGRAPAEIRELNKAGLVLRAEARDEYFPVAVVASASKDEPVLGLDLSTDPARVDAMNMARDSGWATGAARELSLAEIGKMSAWAVFHPVYVGTTVPASVEERRKSLDGFVLVAIQPDRVSVETRDRLKVRGVSLYIFDGPEPRMDGLVCSLPSGVAELAAAVSGDGRLRYVASHELAGRVWTIVCVASPQFTKARQTWYPWAGLVVGLAFTAMLIGYVLGITVYSLRIRRLTAKLTQTNNDLENELDNHRHTLRELHLWEQEFRALAEHSPDIIARFGSDMRHLYVNPAVEEATGHRPAVFVGKTYREIGMPGMMVTQWELALRRVFDTGKQAMVEIALPTPRAPRRYECLLVPEFAEGGVVQTVLAVYRDITERYKRTEQTLLASEQRYRELAERVRP